jgi:hypothetical protein
MKGGKGTKRKGREGRKKEQVSKGQGIAKS